MFLVHPIRQLIFIFSGVPKLTEFWFTLAAFSEEQLPSALTQTANFALDSYGISVFANIESYI